MSVLEPRLFRVVHGIPHWRSVFDDIITQTRLHFVKRFTNYVKIFIY